MWGWYTPTLFSGTPPPLSLYRKTSGLAYREKPPGFYRVKPAPKIGLPGTSNSRQSRHLSQAPPLGLQPPLSLSAGLYGPVLAVKGSLRRFAPWTAPGRSERRAAYEGKGGGRAVGRWKREPDSCPATLEETGFSFTGRTGEIGADRRETQQRRQTQGQDAAPATPGRASR